MSLDVDEIAKYTQVHTYVHMYAHMYSGTSIIRTPSGSDPTVLIMEVS